MKNTQTLSCIWCHRKLWYTVR